MAFMFLNNEEIAAIRRAAKMNLRQFGELLDVTTATASRWESGKRYPSRQAMIKLNELAGKYLKNGRKRELAKA